MFTPTKEEFIELSKQGNLIPIYKEIEMGKETPLTAFRKIESDYSFLLESIEGGEKIARYSFVGADPKFVFRSGADSDNPFHELKRFLHQYKAVKIPGLPRFHGGMVGYIGYDSIRYIEPRIPNKNPDDLKVPEMLFMLADSLLAFDHVEKKIIIISNAHITADPEKAYEDAVNTIDSIEDKLKKRIRLSKLKEVKKEAMPTGRQVEFTSNFSKEEYMQVVEKAKDYISAGDIIQVVPSQRFEAPFTKNGLEAYRILRSINPSPYMYYLKMGDISLVGSSPEVMVRLEDGECTIRPIAGTRWRGKSEEEDKALEKELLASEKEVAEHIMLVDLARNDLGRVCEYGTVEVNEQMIVDRYSHVMHIVSNVRGKIRSDKDCFDLIKASFPAGTVSGAPKIRAMEIIDELENTRRGPYAGSVCYFGFSGELDSAITIRTILLKNKKAYVQAGGGIVADSDPEAEYEETCNKAKALLSALEMVK